MSTETTIQKECFGQEAMFQLFQMLILYTFIPITNRNISVKGRDNIHAKKKKKIEITGILCVVQYFRMSKNSTF